MEWSGWRGQDFSVKEKLLKESGSQWSSFTSRWRWLCILYGQAHGTTRDRQLWRGPLWAAHRATAQMGLTDSSPFIWAKTYSGPDDEQRRVTSHSLPSHFLCERWWIKKKVFLSFPNRKKQLLISAASVMRLNLMLSTHESLYMWASIYYEESFKCRGSYPQTVGARWVFFMAGSDWSVSPQWLIQ